MKKYLSLIFGIAVLYFSCSKSNSPKPDNTDHGTTPPPITIDTTATITGVTPATAEVGAEVTITGTNFGNDINSVLVKIGNSTGIKPKSVSPTKIIIVVPVNSTSGAVSVTVKNAPLVTGLYSFTFIPNYIVKTIGISKVRVALDDNKNLIVAEFLGGGNRITVKAGNEHKMVMSNPQNFQPVVQSSPDAFPSAGYATDPVEIDNGTPPDTSYITFKITGFDKKKDGYNQLNLVLCYPVFIHTVLPQYAIQITRMLGKVGDVYDNKFYSNIFTRNISILTVEIAPPANSYITRDVAVTGAIVVTNKNQQPTSFSASDGSSTSIQFDIGASGTLDVGSNLTVSLVNADKGTFMPQDDKTAYASFSNVRHDIFGVAEIPLAADTVNNLFIRITGFDAAKTGYNQLRIIINDDGQGDAGLQVYQALKPAKILTLPLVKQAYTFDNMNCIQLVTQ